MRKFMFLRVMIFFGLCLSIHSSYADYMKCGTHLISDSSSHRPSKYEVLKKCGEPADRYGNVWIYEKPGYQQRTLQFDGTGRLQSIQE